MQTDRVIPYGRDWKQPEWVQAENFEKEKWVKIRRIKSSGRKLQEFFGETFLRGKRVSSEISIPELTDFMKIFLYNFKKILNKHLNLKEIQLYFLQEKKSLFYSSLTNKNKLSWLWNSYIKHRY